MTNETVLLTSTQQTLLGNLKALILTDYKLVKRGFKSGTESLQYKEGAANTLSVLAGNTDNNGVMFQDAIKEVSRYYDYLIIGTNDQLQSATEYFNI